MQPELAIDVYETGVGVIYKYDALLERIRQGGGGAVRLRLDERDVERYVVGPAPSAMLGLHLTHSASSRWRQAYSGFHETEPFIVTLRGEQLFVGVTYVAIGAAAIDTPVMDATDRKGTIVLSIGAIQGAAYGRIPAPGSPPIGGIDRRELRELFRKRGVLREQSEPPRPPRQGE